MAVHRFCVSLFFVFLATASAVEAEVKLAIQDGRVTLVAENAPLRVILDEWARVGTTKIVNADKLVGPPLSLQLVDVPEAQAIATLLRSASGYLAAPRRVGDPGRSRFDRILILATSRAPAVAPVSPPPPSLPTPDAVVQQDSDDEPDEPGQATPTPPSLRPANRLPVPNPFAPPTPASLAPGGGPFGLTQQPPVQVQTPPANNAQPAGPTPVPTAPQTTTRPGVGPTPVPGTAPGGVVMTGSPPVPPQPQNPN